MPPSSASAASLHSATGRSRALAGPGFSALAVLTLATIVLCLGIGRVALGPGRVLAVLGAGLGLADPVELFERTIVLNARLPRTLLAALSGAGLAVAGAALQGCLQNRLVGPQNVGVLLGAGFGGSLGLLLAWGPFGSAAAAFVGGLSAMLLVLWLGRSVGQTSVLMLVLAGIVDSTLFAALTTLLQYVAEPGCRDPAAVDAMRSLCSSDGEGCILRPWILIGFIL
jgi:iron complex transport system permease protein